MAKATTIKDALKKLEETRGVNTAELDKVSISRASASTRGAARSELIPLTQLYHHQVELYGQCPPIEKMDATLSTLKACK